MTLGISLTLSACLLQAGAARASANPFPVEESFRGAAFGAQWRHGGSAELTGAAETEGWLRLTSAAGHEFGYAYDNEAFPSAAGALVEFEYADWGGSGADGLTFFLFNGATSEAEFHPGQQGGSLGYAPCQSTTNGLSNAYIGVGFDEYGNFTNLSPLCGLDGAEFLPDHVSVRGSSAESYKLLATTATTESLRAERSQARHVTIALTPTGKLSVYIRYPDGTYQKVTEGFQLPAAPERLKFGYVASTGSLTDDHEIRDAQVLEPTQLTPSVTETAGGHTRAKALTWTALVRNEGPNATQRERVRASSGEQPLSSVTWTCAASSGAECGSTSGTGLPEAEAGAMAPGATLTYTITGVPAPASDYAQMTVLSEPRGAAGELDPEREQATVRTDLTPLFESEPSFTLAASGEAHAATVPALGGGISYSYSWQRCQPDGFACVTIAGANATTYHTSAADLYHTLRFAETASNSAGVTTSDSPAYEPLPTADISSAPAGYVTSREAVLAFAPTPGEATVECSLDGGAWSICASPVFYADLSEGTHTFSVRAIFGGLSSPDPVSVQWTVEAAAPQTPTIVSAPPARTASTHAVFKFGALQTNAKLECRLDGGEWAACKATSELIGLASGTHELQARQVNRAGLASGLASYTWTVAGPSATPPRSKSSSKSATAATPADSSQSNVGETMQCSLDSGPFVACKSEAQPNGLRQGWHTLAVRRFSATGTLLFTTTHRWYERPRKAGNKGKPARKRKRKRTHKTPRQASGPAPPGKDESRTKSTSKPSDGARDSKPSAGKQHASSGANPDERGAGTAAPTGAHGAPPSAGSSHEPRAGSSPSSSVPRLPAASGEHAGEHERRAGTHAKVPRSATGTGETRERETQKGKTQERKTRSRVHPHEHEQKRERERPRSRSERQPAGKPHGPGGARAPQHATAPKLASTPAKIVIRPFRAQGTALTSRAVKQLERVASELGGARRVVCLGYTDDLGARSENVAIGLARARAVCAKLQALGVRATLEAASRGEAQPVATNGTAAGRALNRRVELRVTY